MSNRRVSKSDQQNLLLLTSGRCFRTESPRRTGDFIENDKFREKYGVIRPRGVPIAKFWMSGLNFLCDLLASFNTKRISQHYLPLTRLNLIQFDELVNAVELLLCNVHCLLSSKVVVDSRNFECSHVVVAG